MNIGVDPAFQIPPHSLHCYLGCPHTQPQEPGTRDIHLIQRHDCTRACPKDILLKLLVPAMRPLRPARTSAERTAADTGHTSSVRHPRGHPRKQHRVVPRIDMDGKPGCSDIRSVSLDPPVIVALHLKAREPDHHAGGRVIRPGEHNLARVLLLRLLRDLVLEGAIAPELEVRIVGLDLEPRATRVEEDCVVPAVNMDLKAVVADVAGVGLDAGVGKLAHMDGVEPDRKPGGREVGPAEFNHFGGLGSELKPVADLIGDEASNEWVGAPLDFNNRGSRVLEDI